MNPLEEYTVEKLLIDKGLEEVSNLIQEKKLPDCDYSHYLRMVLRKANWDKISLGWLEYLKRKLKSDWKRYTAMFTKREAAIYFEKYVTVYSAEWLDDHYNLQLIKNSGKFWGVKGYMDNYTLRQLLSLEHLKPYHQSGNFSHGEFLNFNFVEFWTKDEDAILQGVLQVCPDIELV